MEMVICGIFSPLLSVSNNQNSQHFDKWVLGGEGLFCAISLIWKKGDMWGIFALSKDQNSRPL